MSKIAEKLVEAGLRPTRQREMIGELLFTGVNRHFTAEDLYQELLAANVRVSLATVYNTLGAFTGAGLLSTVSMDAGSLFYDTNTGPHYHLYDEQDQALTDIPIGDIKVTGLPDAGKGREIDRVDIIVRTRPAS